jgi:hypothetical protein
MNTCVTCQNYVQLGEGESRGTCYLNPPTVFANGCSLRPEVKGTGRACNHHVPLPAGQPTQVNTKHQLETPGGAAKFAREERQKGKR